MGYFLGKNVWVLFCNKVFIRHVCFGEILHFEAFKAVWLSKVHGPALLKEGGQKVVFFFSPQKFVCTMGYHPNNYIIGDLGHSWGTSLTNCLSGGFLIRF